MHKIQLMYNKYKDETLLDTDWFLIKVILPLKLIFQSQK